jgi:ribosomal protein L11 methyltransferase
MPMPSRWLVLTARADDPARRDLLIDGLLALGGQSILEEGSSLTTYIPDPGEDLETFLTGAGQQLAEAVGVGDPPELAYRWQDNEDWEQTWRRGLQPRKVSRRLVVKPSWTDWSAAPEDLVIEIDPQMAFGTGEHATTRGCLRLLDQHLRPGSRVLDVGSGSGILSIAAARLGAAEVLAVEYDPDANLNARENIDRNGVEDIVRLHEAMADEALLRQLGGFDLVVANILSGVIRPLLPAFATVLKGDRKLIVSGILQAEGSLVLQDAQAAGFVLVEEDREDDWWSAVLAPSPESIT